MIGSPCCCNLCVAVHGCKGPIAGVAITVKLGDRQIASGKTDRSGKFCFAGGGAGIYAITATWNGSVAQLKTLVLNKEPAAGTLLWTFDFVDSVTVTVNGCDGPIAGAEVIIPGCGEGKTGADGKFTCTPITDIFTDGVTVRTIWALREQTATAKGFQACNFQFQYVDRVCGCLTDGCQGAEFSQVGLTTGQVLVTYGGGGVNNGAVVGTGVPGPDGYWCIQPVQFGLVPGDALIGAASAPGYASETVNITLPNPGGCTSDCRKGSDGPPCPGLFQPAPGCSVFGFALFPDAAHCCSPRCTTPAGLVLPSTLHVTGSFGSVAITAAPAPPLEGYCNWSGMVQANAVWSATPGPPDTPCVNITQNGPAWLLIGFDGQWLYLNTPGACGPGTYLRFVEGCPVPMAGNSKPANANQALSGLRMETFAGVVQCTYTLNSCDPFDLLLTFTLACSGDIVIGSSPLWNFFPSGSGTLHVTE